MLGPEPGIGIPAAVEQHEQRADAVRVRDRQERVDAALEAFGILDPELVVEEHAHRVHPDPLGEAEFVIDPLGIPGRRLPHLELVDRGGGGVVRAHQPGLPRVPGLGLRLGPAQAGIGGANTQHSRRRERGQQ